MADQLVTRGELASFLQVSTVDNATADLLINLATAKVQAAAGQRLIDITDTALIDVDLFDFDEWLPLPQLPIRSVATVLIDGVASVDWVLRKQMLWRLLGWSNFALRPTQVQVTYTHGYPAGSQGLELARDMTLALAGAGYGNPGGSVSSEAIDDYKVSYADADARMQVTPGMRDRLQAAYDFGVYVTGSR